MAESWCSPKPAEALTLFAGATVLWWVAGGWAIDLFLEVSAGSRAHSDLDIGCFRADLQGLLEPLVGWEVRVAVHGQLTEPQPGCSLDPAAHGLWCRPVGSSSWALEVLVEDTDGPDWIYRRHRRVRRPATEIVARTATGLCYIRPEIQLLYKSKQRRPCDDADFEATWPSLEENARSWLIDHLRMTDASHPWLSRHSRQIG